MKGVYRSHSVQRERTSPAVNQLTEAHPPESAIYRVSRGLDPFEPRSWDSVCEDGTFGNRFDDPGQRRGIPQEQLFRTIYCASERVGALGETTARFRPSIKLLMALEDIKTTSLSMWKWESSPLIGGPVDASAEFNWTHPCVS